MRKHARVRSPDIGLEAAVKHAYLGPVKVEGLYISIANACAKASLLKG